jgi:hypothetical protein
MSLPLQLLVDSVGSNALQLCKDGVKGIEEGSLDFGILKRFRDSKAMYKY